MPEQADAEWLQEFIETQPGLFIRERVRLRAILARLAGTPEPVDPLRLFVDGVRTHHPGCDVCGGRMGIIEPYNGETIFKPCARCFSALSTPPAPTGTAEPVAEQLELAYWRQRAVALAMAWQVSDGKEVQRLIHEMHDRANAPPAPTGTHAEIAREIVCLGCEAGEELVRPDGDPVADLCHFHGGLLLRCAADESPKLVQRIARALDAATQRGTGTA